MFSIKRKRKEKKQRTGWIVRIVMIAAIDFSQFWMRALFANRLSNRGKVQSAKTRIACGLFLKQRSARSLPTRLKKKEIGAADVETAIRPPAPRRVFVQLFHYTPISCLPSFWGDLES